MGAAALLLAGAGLVVKLTSLGEVGLSGPSVRLSDVADGALPAQVRTAVIASVAPEEREVDVRRSDLADLIRRALPGARVEGSLAGTVRLRVPGRMAPAPARFSDGRAVRRGEALTVSSVSGPVRIERRVVALQDLGSGGRKLFVRSADGEIFAAPAPGTAP